MKRIGIIGAMEVEINYLREKMENLQKTEAGSLLFESGKLNGVDVVLVRSGVGKVNAALCAQRLILQFECTHIVNTGIAGSMAAGLKIMDFVVSSDAVYHDVNAVGFGYKLGQVPQLDTFSFPADRKMIDAVKKGFASTQLSKGHNMIEGRIATGDQFISDKNVKAQINADFAPGCVEMEGAAIAHACYLNKIPFVIVRCMSDTADDNYDGTYSFNEAAAGELSAKVIESVISQL